jgi:hypothetical protein
VQKVSVQSKDIVRFKGLLPYKDWESTAPLPRLRFLAIAAAAATAEEKECENGGSKLKTASHDEILYTS